jgi:nucleotide-binding universal stress UspA family protein
MTAQNDVIVVGVGDDSSGSAVRFAVEEARRSELPLHLVHVLQLPPGDAYAGLYGGALENARSVLDAAVAHAEQVAGGDVVVTSELVDSGRAVDELTARTAQGELLVLEHRALGRLHRMVGGSVVQSVAGRAHGAVVSVPADWSPRTDRPAVVTAAVQDPVEAPVILRAAFEAARDRSASLVVLHAWWLASGFEAVVVGADQREEWAERTRADLQPVLAPLSSAFSDVEVTVDVRHAPPAEAVLDASEVSDLLVLGRRHHLLPVRTHLGPVARAALGHATTPVLITPESPVTAKDVRRSKRSHRLLETLAPIE